MNVSTIFKLAICGLLCAVVAALLIFSGHPEAKWLALFGIAVGVLAIFFGAILNITGKLKNDLPRIVARNKDRK
jgi:hypothetical protein